MRFPKHIWSLLAIGIGCSLLLRTQEIQILAMIWGFLVLGMLFTPLGMFIHTIWMGISKILGMIVPKVVLTVIFTAVVIPTAVLSRIFTKRRSIQLLKERESMFKSMDKTFTPKDLEQLW